MYNKSIDLNEEIRIIILPASHPLITGFNVANLPQLNNDDRTILRYVDLRPELVEVYLTDFTFLGTLDLFLSGRAEEESRLEMVTS